MMLENLRYYTSLGFKVLLYDRGGQNYQGLFNHSYHHDDRYPDMLNKIIYYNYTIRGQLRNESVVFDNNDLNNAPDAWARMGKSDKDKVPHILRVHFAADSCMFYVIY